MLEAAGAKRVFQTGVLSTHVQGSCRMGSDPQRSVVDAHGELHDVRRLFIGDGSVVPRTLSVNPSLTIMALASRLAEYIDGGEHGYFERRRGRHRSVERGALVSRSARSERHFDQQRLAPDASPGMTSSSVRSSSA